MIARWLIPFQFVCTWPFLCGAQELRFQHITTEDGLSDNAVTCIYEDRAGYIWVGTERGLNRYDGQRVDHFPPGSTGPMGAHITSITEDAKGRLWVSTADAGLSMRGPSGVFTHFRQDSADVHGLRSEQLNQVLVLDDSLLLLCSRDAGAIWYHLRKGVIRQRGYGQITVNHKGDTTVSAESNWCHGALLLDDRRILLHMLRGAGPFLVDARSGELLSSFGIPSGLITNALSTDGSIFLGGWTPGIYRVDPARPRDALHFPIDEEITQLLRWDKDRLLAATKVGGLLLLSDDGTIIDRYRHERSDASSIRSDRTTCLSRDRSGNLWAGTSKGVSVYAPSVWRFDVVPLLSDERVGDLVFHAIQQDDDGIIRISTSKGFVLVDPDSRTTRLVELAQDGSLLETTGLFRPSPTECFIGTETGIYRYDQAGERLIPKEGSTKWVSYHAGSMFQTRALLPVTVGDRDILVLGALGYGHIAVDRASASERLVWADYPDEHGTLMLRSTLRDAHGVCWSATLGGVVRWIPVAPGDTPNGTVFNSRAEAPLRLPGDDAQALACSGDTIWVALRDGGAASIVNGKARAHIPPEHMPHDALGVALDVHGKVWFTTTDGLLRLDPRDGSWSHVPVNDGRDFRQLTRCIIALKDGRLALCADDHLLLFDPRTFDAPADPPMPRLVDLRNTWGDLRTGADGVLGLPYSNSAFDAMLTGLCTTGPSPLTFLCRLEGIDAAARPVGAGDPLRYVGVPTGTHRLLVRVRDAYGHEGQEHVLLTVEVMGPFWQRWWFFLLVLGAGALGMYLVSRVRQKQRMKLQRVRDRIARDLHDDIGSTLGSISFYSEALKRKLGDTDDAMAQQVAERIGASSRDMIEQMSDIVWSVDPRNDDAGALITRLHAFASDLLAAKNIPLHFHADATLADRKLTAEQRRNIFLICKEVLHNTVKYADARSVSITLSSTGRAIELAIVDDGKGFDPANTDSYNGNGLPNMRSRAEAIGAVFTLSSSPGNGTRASITVPQHTLTPRSGD